MNKQNHKHSPLKTEDVISKIMSCMITHPFDDSIINKGPLCPKPPSWKDLWIEPYKKDNPYNDEKPKKIFDLDDLIKNEKLRRKELEENREKLKKDLRCKTKFPLTDIIDNITTIEYILYTPGYVKEDVNVSILDNYLTVSGMVFNTRDRMDNRETYIQREFHTYNFEEKFLLPKDVDLSKNIVAKCENGLTIIRIPKLVKEVKEPIVIKVE